MPKWSVNSPALISRFKELCESGMPRDLISVELGRTMRQVNAMYHQLKRYGYAATLAPSQGRAGTVSWAHKEAEARRLAEAGKSHRAIAAELGMPRHRVLQFLRDNKLIPEDRLKHRPAQRRQEYRLPVNLARVRLPKVDEADAKLARQAWREFERA